MARKKLSKEERLEKLRSRLETTDLGGRRSGFWSPEEGSNKIRILPETGDMDFFYQEVGRHWLEGDKKSFYCPRFTSNGELDCPMCDFVNDLYKHGGKEAKRMASSLRVRKQYWMNIIDRNDESKGPQIFTPGVTIFGTIVAYINDPEYGDIYDEEEGTDIIIDRSGKGTDTEYQVRTVRFASPLSEDDDQVDTWLDECRDLSYVELSEDPEEDKERMNGHAVYVKPYDRIIKDYNLEDILMYDEEDEEEEEEEEEVHEVQRKVSKRQSRRRR